MSPTLQAPLDRAAEMEKAVADLTEAHEKMRDRFLADAKRYRALANRIEAAELLLNALQIRVRELERTAWPVK